MTRDEILSMARESGFYVREGTIRTMHSSGAWVCINDELAEFAEAVTEKERTARQEAQQRLADLQEQVARSGVEHRKAVQEAVREALQEAEEACGALRAPESCSGVERSLWDVATMACAEAVSKLGAA